MAIWLKRNAKWNTYHHNLNRKNRPIKYRKRQRIKEKYCEGCAQTFKTLMNRQKYCSPRCRQRMEKKRRQERTWRLAYSSNEGARLHPRFGWGLCAGDKCMRTFPKFSAHIRFCSAWCLDKDKAARCAAKRYALVIGESQADHRAYVRDPD